MRQKVIAGNWKMNMHPGEAIEFITNLTPLVKDTKNEVILCVPYIDLFYSILTAQGTNIKIGAQNMGEISGKMLKAINVEYVIIGHSERRKYFNETDEIVNKKVKSAFKYGLKPIVCVGETLNQREEGRAEEVIKKQVDDVLEGLTNEQVGSLVIAYEPIWAIGTGKAATSEDANNGAKQIRDEISKTYGQETASRVIILYGGSVNETNAKELFEMSDIDGGLVGKASLNPEEFSKITNYDK